MRKKLFHFEEIKKPENNSELLSNDHREKNLEHPSVSTGVAPKQRTPTNNDLNTTPVYRSSPRRSNFKSVSSLFSSSDLLRRNAIESCQSRKLSKFVTQINVISEEKVSLSASRSTSTVSLVDSEGSEGELEVGQLTPSQQGLEPPPRRAGECGTRGLTPLTAKARCSILKAHGIFNIDRDEAEVSH